MNKLVDIETKYPRLFRNPPFGLERELSRDGTFPWRCGDGWFTILNSLCCILDWRLGQWERKEELKTSLLAKGEDLPEWLIIYFNENPNNPFDTFHFDQVKEKFGTLRVYFDGIPNGPTRDFVDGAVRLAESLSGLTCEECGLPGTTAGRGYTQTLCAPHRAEYNVPRHGLTNGKQ